MAEIIIMSVFTVVALILGAVGLITRNRIIGNCTIEIMATICEVDRHRSQKGGYISTSIYEFVYNGMRYRVRARTSTGKRTVGIEEKIYIDPDDPNQHYRKSDLWVPYFLIVWSCMVLMSMFGTLLFGLFKWIL